MTKNYYPLYTDGKLDKQSESILRQIEKANGKPLVMQSVQEARNSFLEKSWLGTSPQSVNIRITEIEGNGGAIPLHIYTPAGDGPFPVLLFYHGGGFVLGTLEEFDPLCSSFADGASCIVVSVGYRLAPEFKHPAAVEDAVSALVWLAANARKINGDPNRIAVAGDSAGGNLAVVASIIAREKRIKLLYQVLVCPWLRLDSFERDSYKYFGEGLWLSEKNIYWYRNHYIQNEEQSRSYMVSPGLLPDLTGLPPTLIIGAEFDVLCDEGKQFAVRLKNDGIPVEYSCYDGMLHDFAILPGKFDKAGEAITKICKSLKKVFNR